MLDKSVQEIWVALQTIFYASFLLHWFGEVSQPSLDARQIERKQMKLAMAVGKNRHYRMDSIRARHSIQTGAQAGLPKGLVGDVIEEVAATVDEAITQIESALPADFPEEIHESVKAALTDKARALQLSN